MVAYSPATSFHVVKNLRYDEATITGATATTTIVVIRTSSASTYPSFSSNDPDYWREVEEFKREALKAKQRPTFWPEQPAKPAPASSRPRLPKVTPPKIMRVQARGG